MKGIRLLLPILFLITLPSVLRAQVAGMTTLSVLDMPTSTRSAALGMDFLSVASPSIDAAMENPSLIGSHLSGKMAIGYMGLSAKTNFGTIAYGQTFERWGTFVFGLRFCSYGTFEGYTEEEIATGRFSAADYVFSIGWGRAITDNISFGVTFKPIYSHYESYNAFAIAFDVAGSYMNNDRRFAASLMLRNIGKQLITFDGTVEDIPFELAAGLSYKLKNAPFRFFLNLAELQRWNLSYEDRFNPTSETDPFTGEVTTRSDAALFFDKIGRHIQAGVELNVGKSFSARIGYNYRQTVEMKAADVLNVSGLSFGFGFSIKGFDISYAHNNYHLWQAPNYISVSTDLNRFFRKKALDTQPEHETLTCY